MFGSIIKKMGKQKVLAGLLIIVLGCYLFPIVRSVGYSIFVGDDFSFAEEITVHGNNVFEFIAKYYKSWQGTYSSFFLIGILHPLVYGNVSFLKYEMLFFAITMIIAFFVTSKFYVECLIGKNLLISTSVACIVLYCCFSYTCYNENLYWFTASCCYTVPMTCMLFAILLLEKGKGSISIICAIILGIVGCGAALPIPGFGCYITFLMCISSFVKNRGVEKRKVVAFCLWVIAAITNVIAPGYYVRKDIVDSTGIHPFLAMKNTFGLYFNRIHDYCINTSFVAFLLVILVLGLFVGTKNIEKEKIIFSFLGLFSPVISLFPVVLGNYSFDQKMARVDIRCWFVVDVVMIISIIIVIFLLGVIIRYNVIEEKFVPAVGVTWTLIAAVVILTDNYSIIKSIPYQVSKQIEEGVYQNYCNQYNLMLKKLEKSAGQDIILEADEVPIEIPYFYNFYLDREPTDWVNNDVAIYYGIKSISVHYEE